MLSEWVPGKEIDPLSSWDSGQGLRLMEAPETDSGFVRPCFFTRVSHTDITLFPLYLHENVWGALQERARGPPLRAFFLAATVNDDPLSLPVCDLGMLLRSPTIPQASVHLLPDQ